MQVANGRWQVFFEKVRRRAEFYQKLLSGAEPLIIDHGLHTEEVSVPAQPYLATGVKARQQCWTQLKAACASFEHHPPSTAQEVARLFHNPMIFVWTEFHKIWSEELTKDKWDRSSGTWLAILRSIHSTY